MFDVLGIDFLALGQTLMSSEEAGDIAPLSKVCLHGKAGISSLTAVAALGYLEFFDLQDNYGKFLDCEVMIE
jgi:hypothetical protein